MMRPIPRRAGYANVTATLALIVALGSTGAYAANAIGSRDIRNNSVTSADIRNNTLTTGDVKNKSLRAKDFKRGHLPAGRRGPAGPSGAQGSPGLTEVELVTNASVINSFFTKSVVAQCPTGKHVIGGAGGLINVVAAATGDTVAVESTNLDAPAGALSTSYRVVAHEIVASEQNWGVKATAVCARLEQ